MKKLTIISILPVLALTFIFLPVTAGAENLQKEYPPDDYMRGDIGVEVWVDNEDGIYYEGENITISFRADRDGYVAIYSVDTRGDVNLLYPVDSRDNGRVLGGEIYTIPGRYDDYNLVVSGPEGIEHIQAVASTELLDIPDWYGGASVNCDYYDDRDDFIEFINERYFNCRWGDCPRGFDQALIYVKAPRYYYKPVYIPHYWYDYPDYAVIYIDYPYGGEVYINGIFFGIAPLWIPRVVIGYQWFTIYDRYGYCWESRIYVQHNHTIYLDRSRVKTSRTTASRYKDVRKQAAKYDRAGFVKSGKRVKSVRADSYKKTGYSTKGSTGSYKSSGVSERSSGSYKSSKSSKKPSGEYKGSTSTQKSSGSYKSSSSSKKSSGGSKTSGSTGKSSGSYKSSGSSKESSGGSKSSSSPKKSTGDYKSSGSSKKGGGSQSSISGSKSSGSYKSSESSSRKSSTGSVVRASSGAKSSPGNSSAGHVSSGQGKKR